MVAQSVLRDAISHFWWSPSNLIELGKSDTREPTKQAPRTHPCGDELRVHCRIQLPAQHLAELGLGGIRSLIHVLEYSESRRKILDEHGITHRACAQSTRNASNLHPDQRLHDGIKILRQ